MRIAIDIDSTLHHYWDGSSDAAQRRFGVDLPYERAVHVGDHPPARRAAARLHRGHALRRGHRPRRALPATRSRPSTRWHAAGHFIHITSHRAERCHDATERWLDADRPELRRAALLLRQGQPLRRDRHRRAHRRQPGQPRARDRARASPPPRSCTPGTATSARRRPIICAEDWPGLAARALERRPALRRRDRAAEAAAPAVERPTRDVGAPTCATCCPASSPSARSTTGAARSASRRAGPHARRVLLPPVVPLRGRGHRERARRGRRAAGLQPLGRAAARRAR